MKSGAVTILAPIPLCGFPPTVSNSAPAQGPAVQPYSGALYLEFLQLFPCPPTQSTHPTSDAKCRSWLSPVLLTQWLQIRARHVPLLTCVLVVQLCLTLRDPVDCSPPGSSVHGILQAGILEWVAIAFSRGSSRPRDRTQVSCIAARFFYCLGFD